MGAVEKDEIANRVRKVIGEHLHVGHEQVTDSVSIRDLGGDSLDDFEIVMRLEEEFRILITDAEGSLAITVSDFIKLVQSKS